MIGIKWKVYKGNIETSGGHKLSMTCALFMGFTQDILVGARSEVRTLALSRTKLGKCFCSYPATGIFFYSTMASRLPIGESEFSVQGTRNYPVHRV